MPAYMIHLLTSPRLDTEQAAAMTQALDHIKAIVESFGGRYLTRLSDLEALDGDTDANLVSLIEFPSMSDLRAFYTSEQYRPFSSQRAGQLLIVDSSQSR
jgi:uncharacterized protein (DUF1330 family)